MITMVIVIITVVMVFIGLLFVIFLLSKGQPFYHIDYEGEPWKDCPDCHGTGIVNKGDEHFECECPCKMRMYKV